MFTNACRYCHVQLDREPDDFPDMQSFLQSCLSTVRDIFIFRHISKETPGGIRLADNVSIRGKDLEEHEDNLIAL